jgi:hypothetical protein
MTLVDCMNHPVIIFGAARSGTKLLRSLVAATGRYAEVPFDVNYLWRYGNERLPHDALPADALNERIRRFIKTQLSRCAAHARKPDLPFVEKTVSNVLRVPFVKALYPQAKFIAIVRDGRDVAESAARCWREPPHTGYLLAKARTFPWRHCAPYAWKYAKRFARRRLGFDKHLQTWGPRYPGINDDLKRLSLVEVCARQWVESVERYERSRHLLPPHRLLELRYEELVSDSQHQIHRLCDFLDVENRRGVLDFAGTTVRADRVASRCSLSLVDSQRVTAIVQPTLERLGYVDRPARAIKCAG